MHSFHPVTNILNSVSDRIPSIAFLPSFQGVYFYLSRDVIIKNLAETDKEARLYLKESEDFSKWAADDRQKRLKHKLTPKQKEQVQLYLLMMAENEKDIYPYETKGMKKRIQERS
jgi:hypothetical protein